MTFKLTADPHDGRVDLLCTDLPPKTKKIRWRRDGTTIATTDAVTLTDINVVNGSTYIYVAVALDRRGNRLDSSNAASATPKAAGLSLPTLVGYGKNVTGGGSAIPQKVSTTAQLLEALQDSGSRVIYGDRTAAGLPWLTFGGESVKAKGDLTMVDLAIARLAIRYSESNVRHHDIHMLPNLTQSPDTDGLTVNGQSDAGPVEGVGISNGWYCGGPDMGGAAILGEVFDLTMQHTVAGPGLRQSVGSDERDHNRIFNVTTFGEHADGPYGARQTYFENLVLGGQERNPDLKYADLLEWLRNMTYNARENPNGNPRGLVFAYNRHRLGPLSMSVAKARVFETQHKPDEAVFAASVYAEGNVADGFTNDVPDIYPAARLERPLPMSMPMPTSAPTVDELLALVGPTTGRNAQEARLIEHVRARTWESDYYTGLGTGTPNLIWSPNP